MPPGNMTSEGMPVPPMVSAVLGLSSAASQRLLRFLGAALSGVPLAAGCAAGADSAAAMITAASAVAAPPHLTATTWVRAWGQR